MKTGAALLLLLLVPGIGGCTQPAGMYQHATIRVVDSHLCFSVADSEEARRTPPTIAAISVDKFVNPQWKRLWRWNTPLTPATRLHPDECIAYGYQPADDLPVRLPEPLRPGERYGLSINSEIPNPSLHGDRMLGRMYGLYFCLSRTFNGEVEAVIVPKIRGEIQWQVCESKDR